MSLNFPAIDKPAPAFSALNQNSETVTLDSLKGKKVVLYFYPKAMTPGCTTQACGIRDTRKEFDKLNAVVLGISPDAPARLQKFIDKQELNFDLLSDEDHSIAEAYGVWALKKFMGKEYVGIHRVTFIIDEDGVLRHIMEKVKTKSHHDDALAILQSM
ncbi:MAG: thioredoxin-dependent thiol peroxidase [Oceanospirillaceae bacterium]|nr:thioredoxin-dependent thiol peroxidase [Oceanospirillaceae bacterium]MBT14222.1 thioredoxin-dependent thiol peroxidase [Oceanospirillaceae bacterium]|tara:strand:+ start:19700 stop:20173 length:474 start_codon:yes stop_codon:yes gene_type:complete